MKTQLTKEDFERIEAILKKFPVEDDAEHVNFNKAAEVSKFLIESSASMMEGFNVGIREGIHAAMVYLCVNLQAVEETNPELSGEAIDAIIRELFPVIRSEVRELHEGNKKEQADLNPPVGSVIEYDGKSYQVVAAETEACSGCAFDDPDSGECRCHLHCSGGYRPDGQDVNFIEQKGGDA